MLQRHRLQYHKQHLGLIAQFYIELLTKVTLGFNAKEVKLLTARARCSNIPYFECSARDNH